jgi:hypothetical protein
MHILEKKIQESQVWTNCTIGFITACSSSSSLSLVFSPSPLLAVSWLTLASSWWLLLPCPPPWCDHAAAGAQLTCGRPMRPARPPWFSSRVGRWRPPRPGLPLRHASASSGAQRPLLLDEEQLHDGAQRHLVVGDCLRSHVRWQLPAVDQPAQPLLFCLAKLRVLLQAKQSPWPMNR